MIINKLKKLTSLLTQLMTDPRKKDIFLLIRHVQTHYLYNALMAFLHNRPYAVAFRGNILDQDVFLFLDAQHHRKEKVFKGIYRWTFENKDVYATQMQITGLQLEYLVGAFETIYQYNWEGKIVLDIGGFVGDSALFFFEKQAKKVIVYEPLQENIKAMSYNLQNHKSHFEIHQKAIAKSDGPMLLQSSSPEGNMGFGLTEGRYSVKCEGISFQSLLKHHSVDVAKVDCEGGEKYLEQLTKKELKTIPYWIVETHSQELYHAVKKQFLDSGFKLVKEFPVNSGVDLMHFQL